MTRMRINLAKLNGTAIKRVLIDGDLLVYTIGFAVEEPIIWPDETVEITGDLPSAKRLISNRLRIWAASIPPGIEHEIVLTGDQMNWRKALITGTYKAGRGRKPFNYKGIRKFMMSLPVVHVTENGEEADDYMARAASGDPHTAILSFDKDFFTVPGTFIHLNSKSAARMYKISIGQAMSFMFFQALAGDRVDSYNGVTSIGEKKAAKVLKLAAEKNLTVRQVYLTLKKALKVRQKKFSKHLGDIDLWKQFRECSALASILWDGEVASRAVAIRRVWRYRNEPMSYFLPYYDVKHTKQYTEMRL